MQKDFAEQVGMKPSSLSLMLKGKIKPRLHVALKIEEYTKGEVSRLDLLYPEDSGLGSSSPVKGGTILTHSAREDLLRRHGLLS